MLETEAANAVATSGGGAALLLGLVYTLRKMWRQFSEEKVTTSKDSAESSLISTLREQIENSHQEILKLKKEFRDELALTKKSHEEDRDELRKVIAELESTISSLTAYSEKMKREALEAYTHLLSLPTPDVQLKDKLMGIIISTANTEDNGGGNVQILNSDTGSTSIS
jgi:seryl-tRNA synthetase